jgi:hypothetical protein
VSFGSDEDRTVIGPRAPQGDDRTIIRPQVSPDDDRTIIGPRETPQSDDRTVIGPRAPHDDDRTVIGPRTPHDDERTVIGPRTSPDDERTVIGTQAFSRTNDAATQIASRVVSDQPSPRRRWLLPLIGIVAVAVAAAGVALGLFLRPKPITEPELRAALAIALSGYQCASIKSEIGPDHAVQIAGNVSTANDLDRLRSAVTGIHGIGAVDFEAGVVPWPHCEVASVLTPLLARTGQDAARLAFDASAPEQHIGDRLAVDVRMPNFDGYVNVDYFSKDGQVLHLFPNKRDLLSIRPAYNRFVLFKPPLRSCWTYSGAAGRQLIALTVTPKPLFATPRSEIENAHDYLPILDQAVAQLPKGTGAAAMLFVDLRAAELGAKPDVCPSD